jgi:L-lysine exporter family protein LysE/ArgO
MSYLILGFITGMSLILAIGAQNLFVIEQGLKKEFVFLVCLICAASDILLIFLGIFIFYYFQHFLTPIVELVLNLLLLIFLFHFIWSKINSEVNNLNLSNKRNKYSSSTVIIKTLSFTYLNPHVYSDTVFFLGNFSKSFLLKQKVFFGLGASISSVLFFFSIGYASKYLSSYVKTKKMWKIINLLIIIFMSLLSIYIFVNIFDFLTNL